MKKSSPLHRMILISLFLMVVLFFAGCGLFSRTQESALEALPATSTSINESPEAQSSTPPTQAVPPQMSSADTDLSGTALSQNTTTQEHVNNATETQSTQTTLIAPTGGLVLQADLDKCPHLLLNFECSRYDLRDCAYQTLIGKNEFYPDQLLCRFGRAPGESPTKRYCYAQECRRMTKENVVITYGGVVTFGEYRYSVRKEGEGILTSYALTRCGETREIFATMNDCVRHLKKISQLS